MTPPAAPRHFLLLLAGLCLILVGAGIWLPTGLTGKDEFFLGLRTPMEMMASDHWLVPFLDEAPRIKKPPLLYWLGRISFELLGPSLLSARLLALAFATLLVLVGAGLARRLGGTPSHGWLSGLILLGCLGLHSEGRRFMLDVPVAALSASALWCLVRWRAQPRPAWLLAGSLLLAAGFLVKGPIVALLCGSGVLALLCSGYWSLSELRPHWRALCAHALLVLLIALPWFSLVRARYPEASQLALADELESRQFFHLSPGIVLGLCNLALPWIFVAATALWQRRHAPGLPRLAAWWCLFASLPFLFIRSFDRYLIGSLLPLALLLVDALHHLPAERWRLPLRLGQGLALLLGLTLAGFLFWFHLPGAVWLLPGALALLWAMTTTLPLSLPALLAPALFWAGLFWGVFPALGVNAVPAEVVAIGQRLDVALYDGPQPAMLPILSGKAHRQYHHLDTAIAERLAARATPIFVEADAAPRLATEAAAAGYTLRPEGSYQTLASHGSGLRLARPGSTLTDWKTALQNRDLGPLQTRIEWYTLRRP